ncbi:unnamed protein product [Ceratitis capitata]|uniref:(Mediterranean fruit fly) hypothetical protein n=1 Tax=Ceratitis capitata TaxID=7213 RepID=A0A811UQC7_CERCA|nr:unnamed protein product [Ceratitis capitata]
MCFQVFNTLKYQAYCCHKNCIKLMKFHLLTTAQFNAAVCYCSFFAANRPEYPQPHKFACIFHHSNEFLFISLTFLISYLPDSCNTMRRHRPSQSGQTDK